MKRNPWRSDRVRYLAETGRKETPEVTRLFLVKPQALVSLLEFIESEDDGLVHRSDGGSTDAASAGNVQRPQPSGPAAEGSGNL